VSSSTVRRWAWSGVIVTVAVVAAVAIWALSRDSASSDAGFTGSTGGSTLPSAGTLSDALARTASARAPFTELTTAQLAVDGDCLHLVVADSLDERVQGLRGRADAAPYDGMLFVFEGPTHTAFTMSGVPDALDIGFYDGAGTPVSRLRMEPCAKAEAECPVYRSGKEFVYALETGGGALADGPLQPCPS
jgi:uncharacterized membrane protein (UPF0127 family)